MPRASASPVGRPFCPPNTASAPRHEWVLDIRKHHDTRAVQRPKRWRQINARNLLKAGKTGGDIAALVIDHTRAQHLQHTGAAIVGGAAAQTNIDSLCAHANRAKHELAHAIGCSSQRRRFRARRIPNAGRLGHLDDRGLALDINQHPGRHAVAQGTCHLAGHNLTAARSNGIERPLATICQRQRGHLGIGPHTAHAFGNGRLCLRAQNAALKGVDRQQHTAGPAARRTKVNLRASILTGTCKRCGVSGVRFKIGPTTAISAARTAQTAKIATQQLAAFIRQDPSRHVKPMIQARVGIQIV